MKYLVVGSNGSKEFDSYKDAIQFASEGNWKTHLVIFQCALKVVDITLYAREDLYRIFA